MSGEKYNQVEKKNLSWELKTLVSWISAEFLCEGMPQQKSILFGAHSSNFYVCEGVT